MTDKLKFTILKHRSPWPGAHTAFVLGTKDALTFAEVENLVPGPRTEDAIERLKAGESPEEVRQAILRQLPNASSSAKEGQE